MNDWRSGLRMAKRHYWREAPSKHGFDRFRSLCGLEIYYFRLDKTESEKPYCKKCSDALCV